MRGLDVVFNVVPETVDDKRIKMQYRENKDDLKTEVRPLRFICDLEIKNLN